MFGKNKDKKNKETRSAMLNETEEKVNISSEVSSATDLLDDITVSDAVNYSPSYETEASEPQAIIDNMEGAPLPSAEEMIPEVITNETGANVVAAETEVISSEINPQENQELVVEVTEAKAAPVIVPEPVIAEVPAAKKEKTKEVYTVVSNYDDQDPDMFDGVTSPVVKARKNKNSPSSEFKQNKVEPVKVNIAGSPEAAHKTSAKSRRKALFHVISAIIIVALVVLGTVFYEAGIKEKLKSPLTINGVSIDSSEFSFMYHYILIENGVDIFASDTQEMLLSPSDDPNFATNREFFLDLTAQELQTMQILYDDASSHGLSINENHYALARAYIDWLKTKASDINVPLDTYIKGVFGSQVDEQCVLNTLAKKYFTEDYASGSKLVELSASDKQATDAYNANANAYDLVDYKLIRIVYEQREDSFITTANLNANEIIEKMANDPDMFELVASEYFTGDDRDRLLEPDSARVSNVRYNDFVHTDFRDWLFASERKPGDTTIFADSDGFPIILCFVERHRQSVPLRDVRIVQINYESAMELEPGENISDYGFYSISQAQETAQTVYEYISSANKVAEIENIYTDEVLSGIVVVTADTDVYVDKYEATLNDWIFDENRNPNDKKILEGDGCFYVVFFVQESDNPEWYDRVNSFIRMNNYQAFINEMMTEYTYSFNNSGLEEIQDVP